MFARYLRMAVAVEQIGYCDRISESALQYAERLLSTKLDLCASASVIARRLVYEFKDHGFVIDIGEAKLSEVIARHGFYSRRQPRNSAGGEAVPTV